MDLLVSEVIFFLIIHACLLSYMFWMLYRKKDRFTESEGLRARVKNKNTILVEVRYFLWYIIVFLNLHCVTQWLEAL